MEFRSIWKTQLVKLQLHTPVYSLCFKPDQSQLIAACSNDLFFISPTTGKILEKKRSHTAPVYCVRCSADGTFFASSSSDGTVVIWRSLNNDGFVTYGSPSATRDLVWCPTKQLLISCSANEYNMWRPDDVRASQTKVKNPIESLAFAPNGEAFIISYSNGTVNVLSTEEQTVLQTFNYSSIVTSVSFVTLKGVDYIVTADLDCRVSMYRANDKALVGKNALPFEALSTAMIGDADCFFAFAGVSGKVSLLTSGLSYLGDFETDSKWIWDIAVDKQGRLALGTREGFVELRSIDFGIAFACSNDTVAYRTSINAMSCRNVMTKQQTDLVFFKIIVNLAMCSKYLLIQFKDAISIYTYNKEQENENNMDPQNSKSQNKDEAEDKKKDETTVKKENKSENEKKNDDLNDDTKMPLVKVFEIPGSFENTMFAISPLHLFGATENKLIVQDFSGHMICQYTFQAPITTMALTSPSSDSVVVGCSDGCAYFVMIDQTEPVLLIQQSSSIITALRQGLTLTVIDAKKNCVIVDSFTKKIISKYENKTSFAFSDRVDNLYAVSDGLSILIVYNDCTPKQLFIEGTILAFIRNIIILSNEGAIEFVDAELPFDELIEQGDYQSLLDLMAVGPSKDQLYFIATECLKKGHLNIAKLAAPNSNDFNLSFYINEVVPDLEEGKWSIEVASFLGQVKHIKLSENESGETCATRANELEQAGVSEEALQLYASCGDWDNVLRIAKDKHLERSIADISFPKEVSERAAKVLLDAGLGDGAIRILTKTHNISSLARTYIYLGQWPEAISHSRLYPQVYNIIYPRFGQLLFESGKWFESLVCFFIPQDRDEREKTLTTIYNCCADSCECDKLAFIELMLGLNDPECYWTYLTKSICYFAVSNLKKLNGLPLSTEDAINVFYMCYYVMATIRTFPIRGVNICDILLMLLTVSSILGLKRWLAYSLKELSSFDLDESSKHIAQRAVRANKEATENKDVAFLCPRCGKDLYSSSRFPLLVCGFCGMKVAYSSYSCKPLPLIPFEYKGESSPEELIEMQPMVEESDCEMPKDVVGEEYMKQTAEEYFVVQKLKEKAGVPSQFWFNGNGESVRVCKTCGAMFSEPDYENTTMELDYCPICYTRRIDNAQELQNEVSSDILEMLRTFETESPVTF